MSQLTRMLAVAGLSTLLALPTAMAAKIKIATNVADTSNWVEGAKKFKEVLERVTIDVSRAHFWDLSAVGALDKVVLKFRREGTAVDIIGLNQASATLVDRLGVHDKPDAERLMGGH